MNQQLQEWSRYITVVCIHNRIWLDINILVLKKLTIGTCFKSLGIKVSCFKKCLCMCKIQQIFIKLTATENYKITYVIVNFKIFCIIF